MAEKSVCISQSQSKPIKILKWKVREGITVPVGRLLLLYEIEELKKADVRKLKASRAGTVHKIIAKEGETVKPGATLLELKACRHPTIMNDMCAECGADLRKEDVTGIASVPMVHSIPDLKVSEEQAQIIGKTDIERLLKDRKLVLLVDLDQTLIHTTHDNIPPNIKDVYHFQLHGPQSLWYHTRLRPGTHKFLSNIQGYYELHICTFGTRNYAHTIAMFLDPDQKIFSNRILSRDECFDPNSKKANLKALFPCGDNLVCIIDDREDVWSYATNLIHVKPYHFFQHTGDINAPPGFDKHEDDNKVGFDFTKITEKVVLNAQHMKDEELVITNGSPENNGTSNRKDAKDMPQKKKSSGEENVELNGIQQSDGDKGTESTNIVKETSQNVKISEKSEPGDKNENDQPKDQNDSDKIQQDNNVNKKKPEEDVIKTQQDKGNTDKSKTEVKKVVPEDEDSEILQQEDNLIEIEDPDDYLIYLEDILKRIHKEFYEEYDVLESGETPDLKKVIPLVRNQVLSGCKLAFSGLVPIDEKLKKSKAYQVARGLGATVTQDLEDDTTHLVAVRPRTAKVNAGKRKKNLKIVTPDWLWCCAERWEHVDEAIFPLSNKGSKNRHPPPHCSSPDHVVSYPEHSTPASRKRTPSGRFMDTINPLMSFSSADIADMDKEVEDILDDESDSSEDESKELEQLPVGPPILPRSSSSSSSSEDCVADEFPRGLKRKRGEDNDVGLDEYNTTEDETLNEKFRRGENVDDVLDMEKDDTHESDDSVEPPDEVDDGDWNMMGAALEREFLSNN
ncbi:hypothetical protein NQ315_009690 [Exocentrus adspersus]|uniref:RNA polymerase II subunit A C-terminal domain phosphatase n=1 Tax=Exocentrus adspersus TaxID=1586481 RepID=A0AAV8WH35_9CUCU|nr:hypothetical protein NQ315_009690 [Exocentrus adspersus]